MSIAPEILEAMKEAGASVDVILAAIRADAALADKAVEERRAKDRERQRRHRLSRNVTVTPRDERDPPPKEDQTPHQVSPTNPNGLEPPRPKSRKIPLPLDWQPAPLNPDGVAGRIVSAWPAGRLEREISKFKDHALAGAVKHDDWQAAFRNWIKKADEFDERYSKINGLGRNQPSDGLSPTTRAARTVFGLGACN